MERNKRAVPRITNYRKFHLSGDLEEVISGIVEQSVNRLEPPRTTAMATPQEHTADNLRQQLEEQKQQSQRMQEQMETMRLRNELESEKMKQEQWETAMTQLKEAREAAAQAHQDSLDKMRELGASAAPRTQAVAWLEAQLEKERGTDTGLLDEEPSRNEREDQIRSLREQQEDLQRQIEALASGSARRGPTTHPDCGNTTAGRTRTDQEALMEQLRVALGGKTEDKDPNRLLLKALISNQNKTPGLHGTSTLKPDLLHRLAGDGEFSMAEWLASLNRQDEGESEVLKTFNRNEDDSDCRQDCRHSKCRSGMLDKSTTNIQRKEVWPQRNLGEDWADEEMEFKQLKFEHLVAGETRTIETCTDPAQILGRLRLLRCIAYLKLRGIKWPLLRKMYAAILSSIETREYSWESNFDRFESILYRRAFTENTRMDRDRDHKSLEVGCKRYCKEYNKKEGCPRTAPHTAFLGSGPGAVKRLVYHCCATCIIKDRVTREHPEGHQDCPHRA